MFRISRAAPLAFLAIAATIAGIVFLALSQLQGSRAIWGAALFCLGFSLFDALDRRRLSLRHAAIFLAGTGAILGAWSLTVFVVMRVLSFPPDPLLRTMFVWAGALLAGGVVALVGHLRITRGAGKRPTIAFPTRRRARAAQTARRAG